MPEIKRCEELEEYQVTLVCTLRLPPSYPVEDALLWLRETVEELPRYHDGKKYSEGLVKVRGVISWSGAVGSRKMQVF